MSMHHLLLIIKSLTLLCMMGSYIQLDALPNHTSSKRPDSSPALIGHWRGASIEFHLASDGQATLKITTPTQSQLKSDQVKGRQGYWWTENQKLCLAFDPYPRCYTYTLNPNQLNLKIGQSTVQLIRQKAQI